MKKILLHLLIISFSGAVFFLSCKKEYSCEGCIGNSKLATGDGVYNNRFDIYDITNNRWSIGVLPVNIQWASIISVNNTIYVAGGEVNGVYSSKVWKQEF